MVNTTVHSQILSAVKISFGTFFRKTGKIMKISLEVETFHLKVFHLSDLISMNPISKRSSILSRVQANSAHQVRDRAHSPEQFVGLFLSSVRNYSHDVIHEC